MTESKWQWWFVRYDGGKVTSQLPTGESCEENEATNGMHMERAGPEPLSHIQHTR